MKKRSNTKVIVYVFIGILILLVPLLIAKIMVINHFSWMTTNNDWIGFWGGYSGGVLTLLGVFLTIEFSRAVENNKQRLLLRPYFTFDENMDKADETAGYLILVHNEIRKDISNPLVTVKGLEILGRIKNVGLGAAIQIRIIDCRLENRKINIDSTIISAVEPKSACNFQFDAKEINISEKDITPELQQENQLLKNSNQKINITLSFIMEYEDLLGTKLKQDLSFSTKSTVPLPIILTDAYWEIICISKPYT